MSTEFSAAYQRVSQATFFGALLVFVYVSVVYNTVFLGEIVPYLGIASLRVALRVAFNALWVLAVWSFVRARYADPGVLPQAWQVFVASAGATLPIAPSRREWQPRKATMCSKCKFPRPERAHHCVICQCCILRYDHHCPWIHNCVGFHNHKYFLLLSVYTWLTGLLAAASTLPLLPHCVRAWAGAGAEAGEAYGSVRSRPSRGEAPGPWPACGVFLVTAVGLFATMFLTTVIRAHFVLALQNLTSVEDFYDNMPNPFDQGSCMANLAQVMGEFGADWLLPILPWRPLSDGVTFSCALGDTYDALLPAPGATASDCGAGAGSPCIRRESESATIDLGDDAMGDDEDDATAGLLHGSCGQCPSQARQAMAQVNEAEVAAREAAALEAWRHRYRVHDRSRSQLSVADQEAYLSAAPKLLQGLWGSFWRGRRNPRRTEGVWL